MDIDEGTAVDTELADLPCGKELSGGLVREDCGVQLG